MDHAFDSAAQYVFNRINARAVSYGKALRTEAFCNYSFVNSQIIKIVKKNLDIWEL